MSEVEIISIETAHHQSVTNIYNHYISNSIITFELEEISVQEMSDRIQKIKTKFPFLVAIKDGHVTGYAYANKWRQRKAYEISVETTVYLDSKFKGDGIGSKLYFELIHLLKKQGIKTAIGGIALPNVASIALHEKCGFKKVAEFEDVGEKFGRTINVGYWQMKIQ